MTRVHIHQVDMTIAWPTQALSDNVIAGAMIAGLRQLYPALARQFAEARVTSHIVLSGTGGPQVRPHGAIARDGVGVNPVTSNGHAVDGSSPLQWLTAPPAPATSDHLAAVRIEASPPPGYRPDLVQPQPVPQDALGTPRILPAEAETLMRALSVRVEELAVAVGWLLKQTASHTHVQATGRATLLAPLPQIEHR